MAYHSVGRRCEWLEVHARPLHGTRRSERSAFRFSQIKYPHTYTQTSTKANILVNKDRRACIADFGLSTITGFTSHATAGVSQASLISNDSLMSFTGGGTRRWMSPELLDPERFGMPESEGNRPTRQSDCYALGMVIYEVGARVSEFVIVNNLLTKAQVLCGHHPYVEFLSDILAVHAITEGVRPNKPEAAKQLGFNDELWRTVELCWLEDRNAQPSVRDILSCLNDAAAFWYMREF